MSCKVQLANDLTPSLLPSASQETQQRNQWKNISPPCPVMPGSRLATSTEPWFVRCLGGACGRHRLCEASLLRDKAQGNVWFSHLWLRWWNAAWVLQPLALGTSQVFTLWRTGPAWTVTDAIPGIHPEDGPGHNTSNKIVPFHRSLQIQQILYMPQDGLTRLPGSYWPDTNPGANQGPCIHNILCGGKRNSPGLCRIPGR